MLSKEAESLYTNFKEEYIKNGYLYSGCLCGDDLTNIDYNTILELQLNDLVQKRDCTGFALELTTKERKKLDEKYTLLDKWKNKYKEFAFDIEEEKADLYNNSTNSDKM